jgi:hypothetical protein
MNSFAILVFSLIACLMAGAGRVGFTHRMASSQSAYPHKQNGDFHYNMVA